MIQNAFNVDLSITLILLISFFIVLDYLLLRLLIGIINIKKVINKYALMQKMKIDQSLNKYISLSPEELNNILIDIFSYQLEVVSASDVSESDPNASIILYTRAVEKMILFLGTDSVKAIEQYYGTNYVIQWCEMMYKILENRGLIAKIISKSVYAEGIKRELLGKN